jgi:predicted MFS family arabinose efflux permease
MMRLGGGLAGAGLAGLALASAGWAFIAAGGLLGLGFFMLHNSLQTRVTEVAPQSRASAVAMHAFHFFLGQAAGPLLMGLAREGMGFSSGMLVAAGGLLVLGWVMGRQKNKS